MCFAWFIMLSFWKPKRDVKRLHCSFTEAARLAEWDIPDSVEIGWGFGERNVVQEIRKGVTTETKRAASVMPVVISRPTPIITATATC